MRRIGAPAVRPNNVLIRPRSKEDVAHFEKQIAVESAARINAWNVFRGIVQETVGES